MNRVARCVERYSEAVELAESNGLRLTNPSTGCYQLRHLSRGWILNLYPRCNGATGRLYWDPHHKGPFLPLPEHWTVMEVVEAMIKAAQQISQDEL